MAHPGVETLRLLLEGSGLQSTDLLERRAAMDATASGTPAPDGVQVHHDALGGRPVEWMVPDAVAGEAGPGADAPVVMHLHGGGYCMGGLDTHRAFAGRLALAANCAVLVPDYRLAPEHPFPAAVQDAVAAYRELVDDGHRPERIAVSGDSAGGGLAVALMLSLRDAGDPMPAAAALISPWGDLTQSADAHTRLAGHDPLLETSMLDQMAAAYLAGADPRDPLASPVFAHDLRGLPPLCIEVGELEVLLDDATALAALARRSDVDVSLTVWPELTHDFQIFPADLIPESERSIEALARFIWRHIGR
jgi:acetyl esterase/lipase